MTSQADRITQASAIAAAAFRADEPKRDQMPGRLAEAAELQAAAEKTVRLRALRLAKEAVDRTAVEAAKATKPKRKR